MGNIHVTLMGSRCIRWVARFIARFRYKKCGLMMMGLTSQHTPQFDMFDTQNREKQHSVMAALDAVNHRWGSNTMFYAGAGIKKAWEMKRDLKSPHYTTEWGELLRVK